MKARFVFYLFGYVLVFSFCSDTEKMKELPIPSIEKEDKKNNKIDPSSFSAFLKNTRWSGDKDGSSIGIIFQKEKLEFSFSLSCMYLFPIQIENKKVTMFWANEMDCIYETYLTEDFGLKKKPSIGEPFANFSLINDSTFHVDYLYEEWWKSIMCKKTPMPKIKKHGHLFMIRFI